MRKLGRLRHVNVVVMIKIEEGDQLLLFIYFIDQDKWPSYVNAAFVLERLP